MNKFFKGIALGAAASLMALSFAACSEGDVSSNGSGASEGSDTASLDLVSDGKLIMGTNAAFPPFEYQEGGEVVGVDAELVGEIAERLGLELEIKDMEFESLSGALSGGTIDVIAAGFTVEPDREETMDFTNTYFTAKQTILVLADSGYNTADDLENKKIGGQTSTTGLTCAEELTTKENIIGYSNGSLAVEALLGGAVDAVIIDNNPANEYKDQHGDKLKLIVDQFPEEDYAMAVKKGNASLLNAINEALDEIIAEYIK